jgi:Tfp pilus assembly protein PilN
VLAFLYGSASRQIAGKQSEASRLAAEAQSTQNRAAGLAPYKSFVAMRESHESTVKSLVDSRFDWAHALSELGRVLPPGTSISSLSGTVAVVKAGSGASSTPNGSATPPGSTPTFVLAGCATSQVVVARTVTQLELIDGVASVTLANSAKAAVAAGGSSSSSGPCPVSFSMTVAFQPLPATPTGSSVPSASSGSTADAGTATASARSAG